MPVNHKPVNKLVPSPILMKIGLWKKCFAWLLPCPFCGCDKIEVLKQEDGWLVRCWNGCGGQYRTVTDNALSLVHGWNSRAGD